MYLWRGHPTNAMEQLHRLELLGQDIHVLNLVNVANCLLKRW